MSKRNEEWARKEVELAIKRETEIAGQEGKEEQLKIAIECLNRALNAYIEVYGDMPDDVSYFTSLVFNSLVNKNILSPLTGLDEEFVEVFGNFDGYKLYRNVRYSQLFKEVWNDGKVVFLDAERVLCINPDNTVHFSNTFVTKVVEEYIPELQFPYVPEKFVAVVEELYSSKEHYDAIAILSVNKAVDGKMKKVADINRYYKTEDEQNMEEISVEDYVEMAKTRSTTILIKTENEDE